MYPSYSRGKSFFVPFVRFECRRITSSSEKAKYDGRVTMFCFLKEFIFKTKLYFLKSIFYMGLLFKLYITLSERGQKVFIGNLQMVISCIYTYIFG